MGAERRASEWSEVVSDFLAVGRQPSDSNKHADGTVEAEGREPSGALALERLVR